MAKFDEDVKRKLKFASWASFRITSAKVGQGITQLLLEGVRVCDERKKRIETGKLNSVDPQAWLTDTRDRIADHKVMRLDELMPWRYAASAA